MEWILFLALAAWLYVSIGKINRRLSDLEKILASKSNVAKPIEIPVVPVAPVTPSEEMEFENVPTRLTLNVPKSEGVSLIQKPDMDWVLQRLPIWLGAAAMALAGLFLVKYSIEQGLLSPALRVVLAGVFGALMVGGADILRTKARLADKMLYVQALCGAGLVVLYGALVAASNLYHLIPSALAFGGMIVVTAMAVALSLKQGFGVAVIALVGGFLTPILITSETPNALILSAYLSVLSVGALWLARQMKSFALAEITLVATLLWCVVWTASLPVGSAGLPLLIFLLVPVGAATMFARDFERSTVIPAEAAIIALLGYLYITWHTGVSPEQLGLYGLLTLGSMALAVFRPDHRKALLGTALAICCVLITVLPLTLGTLPTLPVDSDMPILLAPPVRAFVLSPAAFVGLVGAFTAVFVGIGGYLGTTRNAWVQDAHKMTWCVVSAIAIIAAYALTVLKLDAQLPWLWFTGHAPAVQFDMMLKTFGASAFVTSVGLWYIARQHGMRQGTPEPLDAPYALSGALSLGLLTAQALPMDFWGVAFAVQLAACAWLARYYQAPIMRSIAYGLLIISALLSLTGDIDTLYQPWLGLGMIVAMGLTAWFGGTKTSLGQTALVAVSWCGAGWLNDITRLVLPDTFQSQSASAALMLLLCVTLWVKDLVVRRRLAWSTSLLTAITMLSLTNSMFEIWGKILGDTGAPSTTVGVYFLLNALLWITLIPAVTVRHLQSHAITHWPQYVWLQRVLQAFVIFAALTFVFATVRHAWHGTTLVGIATDIEVWSYSGVGFVCGVAALWLGMRKADKIWRSVGMVLLAGTVGKIFLYDSAALSGLLRVGTFMGLGACLLAGSWVYNRKQQ